MANGSTTEHAASPPARPLAWPGALLKFGWRLLKAIIKWPFYKVYEQHLEDQLSSWHKPQHIGVIMDGNRRFAREMGAGSASFGHQRGADKLQELLSWCYDAEIPVVTVWCFSLDNFQRGHEEVQALLQLFEDKTREMADHSDVHENKVRVRYIGRLELLPDSLRQEIEHVEQVTAGYDRFCLNIAMAYGGREEIADALRSYLADEADRGHSLQQVAESFTARSIEPYLYTYGQPEPDLILRTSGEVRLNGFLLWQSAYSEYYFCDSNWPAFRKIDFLRALRAFAERHRRFGR